MLVTPAIVDSIWPFVYNLFSNFKFLRIFRSQKFRWNYGFQFLKSF